MQEYSTVCPRNCYSTCSFKVSVDKGKITAIRPHPGNLATPEGPCLKGLAYIERANAPDRILYPLRKQADGTFKRINWDTALDEITGHLSTYLETSKQHSVLYYAASGMSGELNGISSAFWRMFGGATTTYGNLCWPAGLEATRLTLGANNHNDPWDLENARLIILWGKNPAETNVQEMLHIHKSLENGGQLIVIDPRKTASSDNAQILVKVNPATDAALALGIANQLIERNLVDHDFISLHVLGYEAFANHVKTFTPEYVAEICGINPGDIKRLADLIGNTRPMTLIPGYGMQRFSNGGQTIRALLSLSILTGNIGIKGGCWHYANLQSYVFDTVKEPESYYPGIEAPCFRRKVSMAKLGEDILSLDNPQVKFIWVERGNPLTQNPDTSTVRKAFRKAEFRVVGEEFLTDTALEADIILPAKSMFEQSDLVGSYWNPYVQLKQKVTEPAGEVKPETEIYYLLAKRLGFTDKDIERNILLPGEEHSLEWLNKNLQQFPELSIDKLKEGPILPASHEPIPFADRVFPTPSRKIELLSEQAEKLWGVNKLPDFVKIEKSSSFPLLLMSPNSKNRIHSQFGNLRSIKQLEPEALLYVNPVDALWRNVQNDEYVTLFNEVGTSRVKVRLDYGIKEKCVLLTNGHWGSEGASPNMFTKGKFTDMGFGTAFHDTWVDFKKDIS